GLSSRPGAYRVRTPYAGGRGRYMAPDGRRCSPARGRRDVAADARRLAKISRHSPAYFRRQPQATPAPRALSLRLPLLLPLRACPPWAWRRRVSAGMSVLSPSLRSRAGLRSQANQKWRLHARQQLVQPRDHRRGVVEQSGADQGVVEELFGDERGFFRRGGLEL